MPGPAAALEEDAEEGSPGDLRWGWRRWGTTPRPQKRVGAHVNCHELKGRTLAERNGVMETVERACL